MAVYAFMRHRAITFALFSAALLVPTLTPSCVDAVAAAVWAAWSATGARLEAANRAAGPSQACLAAGTS